jgi:hypothetical protein
MTNPPPTVWIYLGQCPVCDGGLCRVRCTTTDDGQRHLFAMCDECESMWTVPDLQSPHHFPDAELPACPISGLPLYGVHSHWATAADLVGTAWESAVICESDQAASASSDGATLVTSEDIAGGLDVPPISQPLGSQPAPHNPIDDLAYGKDEPRPGC